MTNNNEVITVGKLIELLKDIPLDTPVCLYDSGNRIPLKLIHLDFDVPGVMDINIP